jgi:hypothetical protein
LDFPTIMLVSVTLVALGLAADESTGWGRLRAPPPVPPRFRRASGQPAAG